MDIETAAYEQSIVGAILIDNRCFGSIMSEVTEQDFNIAAYRTVFTVCKKLFLAGDPVDPVAVLHAGAGAIDRGLLLQLMEVTPTAANAGYYCKALREANTLNRLAELGSQLSSGTESMEQARELTARINGLLVERQAASVRDASETAKDFLRRHDPNAPKPEYLPLGFPPLEDVIRVSLGDFIILGGLPSSGKTLMCLQMAVAMAKKYRVGIFSFETSPEKLSDRLMAHLAQIPLGKIRSGELYDRDWTAITEATVRLSELKLDIISAAGMSFSDVQAMALSRGYEIIIIDYLQLIQSPERDRYSAVTKISMQIHTMCQRHKITCLGLSQLSRPEKQKGKPVPPDMSSLRESGQLEQDADAVILLYPLDPKNYKSNRELKIAKNKDGERAKIELAFDGATQTLTPVKETPGQHFNRLHKEIHEAGKTAPPPEPSWVQEAMGGEPLPF